MPEQTPKKTIYQAITAIMEEGGVVEKKKRNSQQGYVYRGIEDVMNVFQPLMAKHHVFLVPEVLDRQREERTTGKGNTLLYTIIHMKYTFYAEDGSSVSAVVVGEGMDSGDKSSNKAMSAAMKYAMFQVFCIPTEEMQDPDADTPPPSDPVGTPICESCGKPIVPYPGADGREVSVAKHCEGSRRNFQSILCIDCIRKLFPNTVKEDGEKARQSLNEV